VRDAITGLDQITREFLHIDIRVTGSEDPRE